MQKPEQVLGMETGSAAAEIYILREGGIGELRPIELQILSSFACVMLAEKSSTPW